MLLFWPKKREMTLVRGERNVPEREVRNICFGRALLRGRCLKRECTNLKVYFIFFSMWPNQEMFSPNVNFYRIFNLPKALFLGNSSCGGLQTK